MLLSLCLPVLAAPKPDLTTSITPPSGVYVEDEGTWSVTVSNVGNATANGVNLTIDLEETNTSPGVYVLGDLGAMSSSCAEVGTTLECTLGSIRKARSSTVSFAIALPQSSDPIVVGSTATATNSESSTSNNADSETASLLNPDVVVAGPRDAHNRHCTGTGLSSFFECELFPSSISSHDIVLEADGSITIPAEPGYSGTWNQSSGDDRLWFQYTYGGVPVAEFDGYGVDAAAECFEGQTTFPGSSYDAQYEVCLQ